jgi:hypothetical protein
MWLQKSDGRHSPSTTFLLPVCASQSKFRLIIRDLEKRGKMRNFALSRRQRGFESRWGHKIKPSLTSQTPRILVSDVSHSMS